jgi:general secretion pathway protein I
VIRQRSEIRDQRSEIEWLAGQLTSDFCPLTSYSSEHTVRRPRRRGLSLIEVLLALTIFMMALVVIGRLVDMGTDREMEARYETRATRLALDKLGEFESGARSLDETTGTFDGPDDGGWEWTAEAQLQESIAPNLYLVKVSVGRDLKGRRFEVVMSQMIFDPAMMGSAAEAVRPDGTETSAEGDPP